MHNPSGSGGSQTKGCLYHLRDCRQTPEVAETKIERNVVSYTPRYQRFLIKQRSYTQQYSHIYTKRILQMRSMVLKAAAAKWKDLSSGW